MSKALERRYLRDQIVKYEMRLLFQNAAIARAEETEFGIAIDKARYLHTIIKRKLSSLHRQRFDIDSVQAADGIANV